MTVNFDFLMIFALPALAVGFSLIVYALLSLVGEVMNWLLGYGR